MTDEQILKRLAEIEGKEIDCTNCNGRGVYSPTGDGKDYRPCSCDSRWNPLDNPADAFALIEKHEVMLWPCDMGWCAECKGIGIDHESLPHAICLAIIEANRGMGDE